MENILAVVDIPRECVLNISLDEVFFSKEPFIPIIRFYTWTAPGYTIGYFQKFNDVQNENNYPVVRRLTGGLAVLHNKDLSYSFILSDEQWQYVYNQEQTYKIIHTEMKNALCEIGIPCEFGAAGLPDTKNFSCTQTFYKDDIFLNGKKIIGSCERRRGKKILIEGSIHIHMTAGQINDFTGRFFVKMQKHLKGTLLNVNLTKQDIDAAIDLADTKYNTYKWKNLF